MTKLCVHNIISYDYLHMTRSHLFHQLLPVEIQQAGFHLGFFVWGGGGGGGDCVQRSIVCEACKVFEPIFEY